MTVTAPIRRSFDLERPLDIFGTLRPLWRGSGDPTMRLARDQAWRAMPTPGGPAGIALTVQGRRLTVDAWGPGAEAALDAVPPLAGLEDDRSGWRPDIHPVIAHLDRSLPGLRLLRTGSVLEVLVPAIIEQKVTGREAFRAFRDLVVRYGEPAPGPLGLRLQPAADVLAELPYYAYHPLGLERRRADTIRRVAARAGWLEETRRLPLREAYRRLTSIPGVGPWTAAEVAVRALGDIDAVSVGDFHLPRVVAWALAAETEADDARMLELLEPFRGQRARAIRLLEAGALFPPRRSPRMPARSIARI
jgi:3-methyladenine DNA glycosylase/8-oxoguanine DNA glycosylase